MARTRVAHRLRLAPRSELGATLVETAIVLPLLLMLTIGLWSTARAWNVHNVMDHAAREAARYGATNNPFNSGQVLTVAQGEVTASSVNWANITTRCAQEVNGASGAGMCISSAGEDPTTDKRVQVVLEYPNYRLQFVLFSTTITLRAQAVSRREPGL